MDPVQRGGPWTRGPCFVLSRFSRHCAYLQVAGLHTRLILSKANLLTELQALKVSNKQTSFNFTFVTRDSIEIFLFSLLLLHCASFLLLKLLFSFFLMTFSAFSVSTVQFSEFILFGRKQIILHFSSLRADVSISFASHGKGRLRNAVPNRVPVSRCFSRIRGPRSDCFLNSRHC